MRAYRAFVPLVPYGLAAQRAASTLDGFLELSRGKVWIVRFVFFLFAGFNTWIWDEFNADGTVTRRTEHIPLP